MGIFKDNLQREQPKQGKFRTLLKESTPQQGKFRTLLQEEKPKLQPHDPRNGLSKPQIAEAEGNKSSGVGSFFQGGAIALNEYGASINKFADKATDFIAGQDTKFFEGGQKYWDDKRKINEIETEDHKYSRLAGEMILDPINLTPAGVFGKATKVKKIGNLVNDGTKASLKSRNLVAKNLKKARKKGTPTELAYLAETTGSKARRVGSSMVAGAGVGYATSKAKNFGNTSLTDAQKTDEDVMSVGIVTALNGLIAGLTKGKVTNAIKDVTHLKGEGKVTAEEAINGVLNNPQEFGFSPQEATKLSEDYMQLVKPSEKSRVDELAKETNPFETANEVAENIFEHPRATEAIDMARDRYASQTYNDRVGGGSSSWMDADGNYNRAGAKGEKNYHQGFELSKADIKKIDEGKITPEIEEKLRLDVDRLENDPNWNTEATPTQETHLDPDGELIDTATGQALFANAQHNLAGGVGAGTVNAGSGVFDENDTADKMADRFIQGMVAGVAGVSGLKMLRKTNPEAFKRVQSWVMDNNVKVGDKMPTDGVQLGVFAGKQAKGFDGKATHAGKYDGQTRFEIDDSKMEVINDGVTTLSTKGYTNLDTIIKHDELFSNYPQLRNVIVKFDKNMKEHANFDGESTITLSNKFKNKDEMSSSIIHEIQHWVQNKEGFAGGGNFDDMLRQVDGKIYNLEVKGNLSELDALAYREDLNFLKDNRSSEAFEKYKNIAGEIEAREVQARKNLTPNERELIPNYENADTMVTGHSDEAYNEAFMAKLDGRHGDFDSAGIHPDDASLDFSRSKAENTNQPIDDGKGFFTGHDFEDLERLTKEKNNKGWTDLSTTDGGSAKKLIQSLFTDTMSAEYHVARELTHTQKMQNDVFTGRIAKVLDTLDDDTDKALQQYLVGTGGENLSPNVKKFGDMLRKNIDDRSAELVRNGSLDERAFKEWGGFYLHRMYEPTAKQGGIFRKAGNFMLDKVHERGLSKEFSSTDVNGMSGWLNEHGFLKDDELLNLTSVEQMQDFMKSEGRAGLLREGKLSITKTVDGKIKLRRDYNKAERESMGEIESAKVTIPETLARLDRLKQHSEFLKRTKDVDGAVLDGKTVKDSSFQELQEAGYSKIDNRPEYGALSGKWVRNDVHDDIGRMTRDIHQLQRWGIQQWNGYHGLWKKSKTVWNPTAHVNNTVGNWALMHMSGVNSAQLPKMLWHGKNQMQALTKIEDLEFKKLTQALSKSEETSLVELKDTAKFALEAKTNGIFGKSQLNDILAGLDTNTVKTGVLAKADEIASKAYQMEDNFNRLSFYLTLRQTGRDAKTSKQMVDFMLPDYSKPLPKGWRALRDSSVTPFISWSYYTMPAIVKSMNFKGGGNAFKMAREGKEGVGAMAKGALSDASKLKVSRGQKSVGKVIALLSAMEYVTSGGEITPMSNLPFTDTNKPEDFKGRRFVIGKDGDKYNTIKMDRILPYAELQNPLNFARSQVSGLLPSSLTTLLMGKHLYNGRDITHKNKSGGDQTIDWIKHFTKQYAPLPMPVMNGMDLADSAIRSKKKRRRNNVIQPRTSLQELFKNIGINTMTYSKRGLKREQRD